MKLLLDEDVPVQLVEPLGRLLRGHQVDHVPDVGFALLCLVWWLVGLSHAPGVGPNPACTSGPPVGGRAAVVVLDNVLYEGGALSDQQVPGPAGHWERRGHLPAVGGALDR